MHQLTVDHAGAPATVTAHPSFDEAHRALLADAIRADYYLWAITRADSHTHYRLVTPADPDDAEGTRRPRITGTAIIEELPHSGLPVVVAAPSPPGIDAP
jgi:hypothetical protein